MKPIFCGNFDFDARSSDLERLFRRYGKVDRVDMKSGYAFIYMDDDRDADYAIRALDRSEFGRKGRRLRVEWSKAAAAQQDRGARKSASSRRSANLRPSKTLFVINFPYYTKTTDLERHFEPYGKIVNVRIRGNFGFVQYESQEDATKALDATNMSKLQDRVITVEYSARNDDERRGGSSPVRRGRDRSPDRRRSPSPYRRERGSPDYGTGSGAVAYRRERGSPDYGIHSSRSPRRVERSPVYGARSSRSPRRVERSPVYGARSSRSPRRVERSPVYGARSSRSPRRVERSSEYGNGPNRSPRQTSRHGLHHGRELSSSPRPLERRFPDVRDHDRNHNTSPRDGVRNGNGNGYGHGPNRSPSPYPEDEEGAITDDAQEPMSPIDKPDMREMSPIKQPGFRGSSPAGDYGRSPNDARYRSSSPPKRERSHS